MFSNFDKDLQDINGTIENYARTVNHPSGSPQKYSVNTSSDAGYKPKGSRAVLSALRALQSKISTMSKEHASMQSNYEAEVTRIRSENIQLKEKYSTAKTKLKDILSVNRELAKRLKNTQNNEQNERKTIQTLTQRLNNLQAQSDIK